MRALPRMLIAILFLLAGCGQPAKAPPVIPGGSPGAITPTRKPLSENEKKLDSNLLNLLSDYQSGRDIEQAAQAYGITVNDKKEVLVDVYINGSLAEASAQLRNLGMAVQSTNEAFKIVEGRLAIDQVLQAAQLDFVNAIQPVMASGTDPIKP